MTQELAVYLYGNTRPGDPPGYPAPELLTLVDTTLIPLRAQYGATLSKPENRNRLRYGGFAIPCTPQQRLTDHS
jgi:hypothetical protein